MSKTCPNCGVNSPDNDKFCIECAQDLSDVPVVKEEPKKTPKNDDNGSTALGCIILIVIAVVIVAAGFFIFGSDDSGDASDETLLITFDEVSISKATSAELYYYTVTGYITNFPSDCCKYMLKTVYYDSTGKQLTSTTEKLSYFEGDDKYSFASTISSYSSPNYLDVDHVSV